MFVVFLHIMFQHTCIISITFIFVTCFLCFVFVVLYFTHIMFLKGFRDSCCWQSVQHGLDTPRSIWIHIWIHMDPYRSRSIDIPACVRKNNTVRRFTIYLNVFWRCWCRNRVEMHARLVYVEILPAFSLGDARSRAKCLGRTRACCHIKPVFQKKNFRPVLYQLRRDLEKGWVVLDLWCNY